MKRQNIKLPVTYISSYIEMQSDLEHLFVWSYTAKDSTTLCLTVKDAYCKDIYEPYTSYRLHWNLYNTNYNRLEHFNKKKCIIYYVYIYC